MDEKLCKNYKKNKVEGLVLIFTETHSTKPKENDISTSRVSFCTIFWMTVSSLLCIMRMELIWSTRRLTLSMCSK